MMNKIAFAAALLLSAAAAAQTPAPGSTAPAPAMAPGGSMAPMASSAALSAADKKFVEKAASGGMAEIQAAQLAQQKAQDQSVKDFAQKMITDHTANDQQLTTLAQQKGVTVPTEIDAKDQKELDKLAKLDGTKFDKAYLKAETRDHEEMLKLMEKEAKSGKDADLKSFAEQTIPTVKSHLDMAKTDASASK